MANSQAVPKHAIKELDVQLTCAICHNAFKDPKLLQCFHVYCKDCLQRLVTDRQGQLSLCCPTCQQSTLLPPATSVSDLQPVFHIHHLLEIQDALEKAKEPQKVLCTKCNKNRFATSYCCDCEKYICAQCKTVHGDWDDYARHEIVALEELESKVKQLDSLKKVILYCSLHKGKELELYCETCEELICHNCTVKKHCRPEHKYDLVDDTFEKHKAEMVASLDSIENQLGIVNKALEQIKQRSGDVNQQREATKAEVQRIVQQLHEILEARKTELIRKVDEYAGQKVKNLDTQKDEVERVQTRLASCLSFVRKSLRTGSQGEVMKMKKTVMKQVKEMTEKFKPDMLPPCEAADLKFVPPSDLARACQQFGEVYLDRISPKNCYATGDGLELANVCENATAALYVVNEIEAACATSVEMVKCKLVSVADAKRTECSIKAKQASIFEIGYKPTSRGRHQLHIKVERKHIKGSPFTVIVKMPVGKLSKPVKIIKELNRPWGVAVNQRGQIITAEKQHITIFSPTGEKLQSFEDFNDLRGVAVDCHGNIVVADAGNNRIRRFNPDGKLMDSWFGFECSLSGVSIHPQSEKIYVSDFSNHCIHILNPDLTRDHKFGEKGNITGQFRHTFDIAFDSAGNVYVVEKECNNGIQVFTAEGQYLRSFGSKGSGPRQLNFPCAIAICDDVVYIAEQLNNRVSIFKIDGTFQTSFGTRGSGPGQFKKPKGITVDRDGFVYVSDDTSDYMSSENGGRIQIF